MQIIKISALENGAHENQTMHGVRAPAGWAIIPDDMAIPATFPFVTVEASGGIVTALSPDQASYDAAVGAGGALPPTDAQRLAALEAENKLLAAQIAAQSDQLDFYEDCIAEMAAAVYA